MLAVLALGSPMPLPAQTVAPRVQQPDHRLTFVAGALLAFGMHESGHLTANAAFADHPYVIPVNFGPVPFFAIAHRDHVTPRQDFVVASAGFWVQEATNEWLLTAHPQLRDEDRPLMKGMFAFNIVLSAGYAATAALRVGPRERDTRYMSVYTGLSEPVVGAIVLAPAALDAYRYFHPEKRWPAYASRLVKIGTVALAFLATAH